MTRGADAAVLRDASLCDAPQDEARRLSRAGKQVLRFSNSDILKNTQAVMEVIFDALDPSPGALRAPPSPPAGERGK
jgi:very-short-patch-repair endonuclease